MNESAELLESLANLIWPLLAAVLVWRLLPSLAKLAESRSFTIKFGGMEISAQEATTQLATQIKDLQDKFVTIENRFATRTTPDSVELTEAIPSPSGHPKRLLWIDDKPKNNAFEIARLSEDGWEIVQALSTNEALAKLDAQGSFAAVISDMGRVEAGRYVSDAGIQLIRRIRQTDKEVPIFIYSTQRIARTQRSAVIEAGGTDITASPVDLLRGIARAR